MTHKSSVVAAILESRHSAAVKALDTEIKAAQGNNSVLARLYLNRGTCHQKLGLYRKALKDLDDLLLISPGSIEALYRKGQVLLALKRREDAVATWEQGLQACTSTTDAQLIMDIAAAIREPSCVLRQFDITRCVLAQMSTSRALTVLSLVFLLFTCLLARHSFKVGTSLALGGTFYSNGTAPGAPVIPTQGGAATGAAGVSAGAAAAGPAVADAHTHAAASPMQPTPSPPPPAASTMQHTAAQKSTPTTKPAPSTKPAPATCDVEDIDCVKQQAASKGARQAGTPTSTSSRQQAGSPSSDAANPSAISNSVAIQLAVTQINAGQVAEAEALLDRVLASSPKELGALVARGTARALRRELKGAVQDFGAAIEIEPRYADTWKRRGQARSALGEVQGALTDLQKAIDLLPLWGQDTAQSRAECYVEKGMLYQKQRDYRRACKELKEAVKLDPRNHQAWNVLGLCQVSQGDIRDGVAAYQKAVSLKPDLKEALFNMAQALKEEGAIEEAERAFARLLALDTPESGPNIQAMRVIAQMRQQQGRHARAIEVLDKAIGYGKDEQMVELLYLRAICHHALGNAREAVEDYERCLTYQRPHGTTGPALTEEARSFQYLSFYQKEMVLHMYHSFDRQANSFCMDAELSPSFKELWCKKGPPTSELIAHFTPQPPLPAKMSLPATRPDAALVDKMAALADRLGLLLQNEHQGFYPNVRQQRAAGFAMIELAQAVRKLVASKKSGNPVWVNNEGSSVQAGTSGRHQFGWRDAMDIVVKWRQLSEPNDQVVWVDLLTKREFEQGFGSHTPIFSGQTKCVRYYMNFGRALELQKQVLLREGHAFDAQNRPVPCGSSDQQDAVKEAKTAGDMYNVLRQDSWVVVPIASVSRPGHSMEGTRLTLVKVPNQPDAYEFSIRTPVTPPRWRDFDVELEAGWEAIIAELSKDRPDPQLAARAILTYGYYWYNFMPLARGTAACGYTTILSLFWAAGMPISTRIPKNYQVDWEAILSQHPDQFIDALSKWMYSAKVQSAIADAPLAAGQLVSQQGSTFPEPETMVSAEEVVGTVRMRIDALNGVGRAQMGK